MNKKHLEMGDSIRIDFSPQIGVEIAERRSALFVSRTIFISRTNFVWVSPIPSTIKNIQHTFHLMKQQKHKEKLKSAKFVHWIIKPEDGHF